MKTGKGIFNRLRGGGGGETEEKKGDGDCGRESSRNSRGIASGRDIILAPMTEDTSVIVEDEEEGDNTSQAAADSSQEAEQEDIWKRRRNIILEAILLLLYNVYLGYAIYYHTINSLYLDWCGGLGFLIVVTGTVYSFLAYFLILKPAWLKYSSFTCHLQHKTVVLNRRLMLGLVVAVLFSILVFLLVDTRDDRYRLVSVAGIVTIVAFGFIFSKARKKVVWSQIIWGLSLQFIFGIIILRWEIGREFFDCFGSKVDTFLEFTDAGSSFVFGYLVDQKPFIADKLENGTVAREVAEAINQAKAVPAIVVFKSLSTIYFFSFLASMLTYWGALQWLVVKIGWFLQVTIGTSACESVNAAANIFLGQATAPFLIKPYLSELTMSELHAVMTGGFATIAGTVLAAYVSFGLSSAHLVSASVMSAPAALAFAKLFYPETETNQTKPQSIVVEPSKEANVLDAATQGAASAGLLVVNITAIVVAFIATMALLNSMVGFLGALVGFEELTFDIILGKLFIPLTFVLGVEWDDCEKVARLIGIKTILNEFIAFQKLGELIQAGELSQRSIVIATYALCGFANPGSIGVQLATLSTMAPNRKSDFSKVALRAFISGTIACLLTACIAGALFKPV